jgi:CRP/FNR family transcriptional regulator
MSTKNIIGSLDFFSSLSEEQIDFLSSISAINKYPKEYVVYYEKKEHSHLLFLLSGLAKSYKIYKQKN